MAEGGPERARSLGPILVDYHSRRVTWERLAPAIATVGLRVAIGKFRWSDAAAVAAAVAAYGPLEWVGHHVVLHGQTLGPFGGDRASEAYACHRVHHQDSDDLDLLFVRYEAVPRTVIVLVAGAVVVAPRTTVPLTGLASMLSLMAGYHLVHYLMHVPYEGRGRWYQRLKANHMLHHGDPDEAWRMGVLFMSVDRAMERFGVDQGSDAPR